MKPALRGTLYWKLSATFLALCFFMGSLLLMLQYLFLGATNDKMTQFLNWGVAQRIAQDLEPYLQPQSGFGDLRQAAQRILELNPSLSIYLIDSEGTILQSFAEHDGLEVDRVRIDRVEKFTSTETPATIPLYGTDPGDSSREVVFSAAPVKLDLGRGFIYVPLANRVSTIAAKAMFQKAAIRTSVIIAATLFAVTAILGLLAFYALTRRLSRATQTLHEFSAGNFANRLDDDSKDEIGTQARVINSLADAVVAQVGELERKDNLRRELVANVSHDLRGPTTLILGYLQSILQSESTLGDDNRRHCEVAYNNARSLSTLLAELFELGAIEAKETVPDLEPVAVDDLFSDVVHTVGLECEKHQIRLELQVEDRVPRVIADIAMISRVLANLVQNAIRYTPPGGAIMLRARTQLPFVSIEVADTGIGIDSEQLPHIFERHYQASSTGRRAAGASGLGLAIVRRIVESHGSTISAQSTVGAGTSFSFQLAAEGASSLVAA